MNLQLDRETESLIRRQVETGRYRSASELVKEAVQLLEAEDRHLDDLRAKLQVGLDDIERGATSRWTPELREQIRESARRRALAGEEPSPDVCPGTFADDLQSRAAGLRRHSGLHDEDLGT